MTDMIERVAREQYRVWSKLAGGHGVWDDLGDEARQSFILIARAAIEAMPGWEPIETAPKDGEHILVAWIGASALGYRQSVARWVLPEDTNSDGWWTPSDASFRHYIYPTHWMPLPALPPAALKPEVRS